MKIELLTIPEQFALVLLLASCASAPLAPVHVEIPVFTPCVKTEISRSTYEVVQLPATATDGEIILALARDRRRRRDYGLEVKRRSRAVINFSHLPSVDNWTYRPGSVSHKLV